MERGPDRPDSNTPASHQAQPGDGSARQRANDGTNGSGGDGGTSGARPTGMCSMSLSSPRNPVNAPTPMGDAVPMGHYSYLVVGDCQFLYTRNHYDEELAALFSETDRAFTPADDSELVPDDEWGWTGPSLGYYTTARALQERLNVQGFTTQVALAAMADGIDQWRAVYERQSPLREQQVRGETVIETLLRPPREPEQLLAAIGEAIRPHRPESSFTTGQEYFDYEQQFIDTVADVEDLRWYMGERCLIRLIVDQASDQTRVGLDLGGLTGCCVHLDPVEPVAGPSRERQLAVLPTDAPLIVLTEGSTDSRRLTEAMRITHPHLEGFVNFIDYAGTDAEAGVGALARMVNAFIAAGVVNRFVAIADNDGAAHKTLAKIKRQRLPANCRVLHYPELPLLTSYPTIHPASSITSLADVNGVAGSMEMYFGEELLTVGGELAPVYLEEYDPSAQHRHGVISGQHKKLAQNAFRKKLQAARKGQCGGDWSGVHAIIESIVHAFD
ncbi:HEPN/Toprim-associated domain-containing protein [Streptomyces sp. PA03-6a]|nr:HEPN/Toprim-associated domain-containing protein [Streptomyces sp. PA03-6a]